MSETARYIGLRGFWKYAYYKHQDSQQGQERPISVRRTSHIAFLKRAIGFFLNDRATAFRESAAGTRLLGLAAALITTVGPFESIKAVDIIGVFLCSPNEAPPSKIYLIYLFNLKP
jgi:hypothetical protein